MKKMVQMIGCLAIVLFLSSYTMLGASNKPPEEIQKKERIKNPGYIGILIQDITEKIARKAKLDSEEGAFVKEVVKNSPADSAGIQEGDVIIEFKGKKLFDSDELAKLVRRTIPGTKADLVLIHDGQKKTLHVIVGRKKMSKQQMFGSIPDMPDMHGFMGDHILGLQLLALNEQLGEYFGTPNNEGVLVEEVEHESTAEKAGFKAGDIIIRVGKRTVDAVKKIQRELRAYDKGDTVEFEVLRNGAKKTLSVEIDEDQDQCVPQRFFFRKPHLRIFRADPFDDAEMNLDMEELRSGLDRAQIEIKKSIKSFEGTPHEISNIVKQFELLQPETVI